MLWSPAILLLFVGAALASSQNGYRDGKEYTYKVKSRTLASFNQQSKQYTGIIMEAHLTLQPNGDDLLRAKITQPRYTQIHTRLENGWDSEIPQGQLSMQSFPLSSEPFEIKTKNGVVRDLIVDKDVPTWEVNVLKSIASQLQVDTQGQNAENSKHNQFPEGHQPYALFKAMEDSVGGKCEVMYDISPLPHKVFQTNPELAPLPELREDGDIISLVKTKNYSNCDQRVSYHFGLNGRNKWEPGSNDNGRYLSRSSVSRIVISGNLKKYTIQSSVTTNKVVLNPDQQENHQGMVASRMNITLHEVKDISEQVPSPSNPQSTGNLVYNYNSPSGSSSSRRPNKWNNQRRHKNWYNERNEHNEHNERNNERNERNNERNEHNNERNEGYERNERNRYERNEHNRYYEENDSDEFSYDSMEENNDDSYLQKKPKLTEPPQNPMLPYFIGNHGNMIQKNNKVDAVKAAKNIAQEIGNELQNPDNMPESQTLEKFTILARLIRTMNAEQVAEAQRDLYEQPQSSNQLHQNNKSQKTRWYAWVAYRDALAQAGTGPALVNIKQLIQSKQIKGTEAAAVIDATAKSARTPTNEYMDAFFDIVTMQETKKQRPLRDASLLAFADLIRHAVVNKKAAHNRYPVHAFGRLVPKDSSNVREKYMPYLAEELKKAIDEGDSEKMQVYAFAIGRTAHPQMLSVFEPYLEGKKPVSPFQRLVMVVNLIKLTTSHQKLARSVLYKIYSNNADNHEIRTAAVYLLMKTNPPASMLQRMADYTNYDVNKHVNSAVKSTIKSLAQLQDEQNRELSNAARAAVPLLTSEQYGPQYSHAIFKNYKNPKTHSEYSIAATYIGSDDSIIPKGGYLVITPVYRGLKVPKIQFGGALSSIQDVWNFMQQKLGNWQNKENQSSQKAKQQKYSPENIAKMLGIHGDEPEQVEGFAFMTERSGDRFFSFDNHTIEKMPEQWKEIAKSMKNGENYEATRLGGYEVTMSFPMETGYPFSYTLKAPTVMSIQAESKLKTESDSNSEIPKSASVSGKGRILFGMKMQKRLGFVVPFEHQEYIAGVDRNVQLYLPLQSEIAYDKSKKQARIKIQPNEDENEYKVLQYKTQPFTSKNDILNLQPVASDKNTHTIHKDYAVPLNLEMNDQNGKQRLKFKWESQNNRQIEDNSHENKKRNAIYAAKSLAYSVASLFYPNVNERTEYEKYSVKLMSNNDMNLEIKASYDSLTSENKESDNSEDWSPKAKVAHLSQSMSQDERKEKLLSEVAKNINSVKASSVDFSVQLNGDIQASASLTAAVGHSNFDQKSRALLYAAAKDQQGQTYHLAAGAEAKNPNVETLDYEKTLEANNRREFEAELRYGKGKNSDESKDKVKIYGKAEQSEDRTNQIRQSHDAQECNKERNNKMIQPCQNANKRASSLDFGEVTVNFESGTSAKQYAMEVIDYLEQFAQEYTKVHKTREDHENRQQDSDKIKIKVQMSPHDDKMDITVKTPESKIEMLDVDTMYDNNSEQRLNSQINRNDRQTSGPAESDYQSSTCNLDKSMVQTFDDHRYNVRLGKCWHVAMTSYPKNDADRPNDQQPIPNNMHVTVLTRENEDEQKEIKITLGDKEIHLTSSGPREPKVKVNGEKVHVSKHKSHQEKQGDQVVVEIFELPDKSVKLVSDKYNVKLIYDGSRAQLQAGDRYRDSVRGLCGTNDGEPENDQKTPKGCLLQKSDEFAATYALTNDEQCQGPANERAERAKKSHCNFESARPGNVISDTEAGRRSENGRNNYDDDNNSDDDNRENRRCMTHRTKVVFKEKNNQICFSLRPLPACSKSCRPSETKSKDVQFHCVARSNASEKVAERVEKGANPDLSQKSVTYTDNYQLPLSCKA